MQFNRPKQLMYLDNLSKEMLARINNRDLKTDKRLSSELKLSEIDRNRLVNYYNELLNDIYKIKHQKVNENEIRSIFLKYTSYELATFFESGKILQKVPKQSSINKVFEFLTTSTSLSPKEQTIKEFFGGKPATSPKEFMEKMRRRVKRPSPLRKEVIPDSSSQETLVKSRSVSQKTLTNSMDDWVSGNFDLDKVRK